MIRNKKQRKFKKVIIGLSISLGISGLANIATYKVLREKDKKISQMKIDLDREKNLIDSKDLTETEFINKVQKTNLLYDAGIIIDADKIIPYFIDYDTKECKEYENTYKKGYYSTMWWTHFGKVYSLENGKYIGEVAICDDPSLLRYDSISDTAIYDEEDKIIYSPDQLGSFSKCLKNVLNNVNNLDYETIKSYSKADYESLKDMFLMNNYCGSINISEYKVTDLITNETNNFIGYIVSPFRYFNFETYKIEEYPSFYEVEDIGCNINVTEGSSKEIIDVIKANKTKKVKTNIK